MALSEVECNDCHVKYRKDNSPTTCELCGSTNITVTPVS